MADYSNNGAIVAALAGDMPPPLGANPKPHLAEPMPVTIVGLEFAFDQATRTSACKLVRREARVAEVRRTPKLEATAYVS